MFQGPVFLVGRPRSGTKLLRSLLNRHSAVSIPYWESSFIPSLEKKALTFGDLSRFENFQRFFTYISRVEFFRVIAADPRFSDLVNEVYWYQAISEYSYAGALAAFYEQYARREGKWLWGDKSPHYMLSLESMKQLFPKARFIHIIRDVRDNCLSNMQTWCKNPYRSAQLWTDGIESCRRQAKAFSETDYLEVRYEDLLVQPEATLQLICSYLEIEFEAAMLELKDSAENLGSTRGMTTIVSNNMDKWRQAMTPVMLERIETIAFDLLQELGYSVECAQVQRRLSPLTMQWLKYVDAWNRFRFDCSYQGGVMRGLRYQYYKRRYG